MVYRAPEEARQAFSRLVEGRGVGQAVEVLRNHPEKLGPLVTVEHRRALGMLQIQDDRQARALALSAAVKGREAVEADLAAQRLQPELARARTEVDRMTGRTASLNGELGRLPKRRELEHQIARAMGRLLPRELHRLRTLLNTPQLALAQRLHSVVRDVLLGRETDAG